MLDPPVGLWMYVAYDLTTLRLDGYARNTYSDDNSMLIAGLEPRKKPLRKIYENNNNNHCMIQEQLVRDIPPDII